MTSEKASNTSFFSNPFNRGMIELAILIVTGVCGLIFSWAQFSIFPITNIIGGVLIVLSFVFHARTEKKHKQAHQETGKIEKIVTGGVYGKIRHPLYVSLIVQNIGIALAFGIRITLVLALLSIIHWCVSAVMEEAGLMKAHGDDYARYRQKVRWRMVPGLF